MSETYKKILSTDEYLSVFKIGEFFDGSETARFVASKINERISELARKESIVTPVLDKNGKPELDENGNPKNNVTHPKSIELVFTRAELDGFFIGVKETLKKPQIKAADITMIRFACAALGMKLRFEKYADSVLSSIALDPDPMDEEVITDPLD